MNESATLDKIKEHLLKYKDFEGHVVLFPLTGSLFNYYCARGMLQEMQRLGEGKNLRVLTITYIGDHGDPLSGQVERIIKKETKTISIIDLIGSGSTKRSIISAFWEYNINFLEAVRVEEHQQFVYRINGKREFAAPTGLVEKYIDYKSPERPVVTVPISHAKGGTDGQDGRAGFVKEILTDCGRIFYHIGDQRTS